jgi:hypothetical protein
MSRFWIMPMMIQYVQVSTRLVHTTKLQWQRVTVVLASWPQAGLVLLQASIVCDILVNQVS